MSKIASVVIPLARRGIRENVYSASKYVGGGLSALPKVGIIGVSTYLSIARFGDEYGYGGATLMSLAGFVPYIGNISIPLQGAISLLDKGNEIYKKRRRLELAKPIQDNWGTIQLMRQESIRRLARDRSALGRVLGNEASRMARR